MKHCYRFFGPMLDTQEAWLNNMAAKGYRLVRTEKLLYEFEECTPGQFQYCVDFIGHKSRANAEDYRNFLQDLGYRVFYKNANLNWSVGKVRFRPWAESGGRIATNAATYNRELLIVEKSNDGKPFALRSTNVDRANYCKPIRNSWLTIAALLLFFTGWTLLRPEYPGWNSAVFGVLGLLCLAVVIRYQIQIVRYTAASRTEE